MKSPKWTSESAKLKTLLRTQLVELDRKLNTRNQPNNIEEVARRTQISSRKLREVIKDNHDAKFTWEEIVRIESVLREKGLGILRADSIYDLLAQRKTVFLIPGYADGYRHNAVPWDIKAMLSIRGRIEASMGSRQGHDGVFKEEFIQHESDPDKMQTTETQIKKILQKCDDEDCHIVVIGSPRATQASRIVLEEILGISMEKKSRSGGCETVVPFQFVWPFERKWEDPKSRFHATPDELRDKVLRGHIQSDTIHSQPRLRPRALILNCPENNRVELSTYGYFTKHPTEGTDDTKTWQSYGIVVGENKNGRIRLVCAGLGGAETLAAAHTIDALTYFLGRPPLDSDEATVAWHAVTADIRTPKAWDHTNVGDFRELIWQTSSYGPFSWPYPASQNDENRSQ